MKIRLFSAGTKTVDFTRQQTIPGFHIEAFILRPTIDLWNGLRGNIFICVIIASYIRTQWIGKCKKKIKYHILKVQLNFRRILEKKVYVIFIFTKLYYCHNDFIRFAL